MGARWYDPVLGRFIQADTLVPEPGNPQSLNRYSYVRGNPLKYTDPTGHCVFGVDTVVCLAVGGAIVGAAIGYGTQVYDNMQEGMPFGDALTTDIEPTPILQGLFLGGAVATAGAYVATALGISAGAGTIASSTATAACADGDCGNEARAAGTVVSEVTDDAGLGMGAPQQALPAEQVQSHHLFPQQFRPNFEGVGIDIDQHTVTLPRTSHLAGVHGRGGFVGPGSVEFSGRWNERWAEFWSESERATAKDVYQFAGKLMDEFGLSSLPIRPY